LLREKRTVRRSQFGRSHSLRPRLVFNLRKNHSGRGGLFNFIVEKEPARYIVRTGMLLEPHRQAAFARAIDQIVRAS
jgi:hypothetical protein